MTDAIPTSDCLDRYFPRYDRFGPAVPVWHLTAGMPPTWHRFFNTSAISPSGRYVASGHPTLHPDGRHVLTDAYPDEPVTARDGRIDRMQNAEELKIEVGSIDARPEEAR